MREDNIVRSAVVDVGKTIAGDTGAAVTGVVYDTTVAVATIYSGAVATKPILKETLNANMPKILKSKLFSHNNGYGIKIGKNIEMFYQNPNAKGGLGGTIFSYKGSSKKFRIDWDPAHSFHTHPPGH